MTKKKYKIGICFRYQKCLYCRIDLIKETCECKKTVKLTKANRTACVKNAFPRVFNPNDSYNFKQIEFIKTKTESIIVIDPLAPKTTNSFSESESEDDVELINS